MVDVTNGTDIHMGLGTLESSGQSTSSHLVAGEDMVDGVDGAWAQQGRAAGARQKVQGTRNARHLAIEHRKTIDKKREQEEQSMRNEKRRINSQIFGTSERLVIHCPIKEHEMRRSGCHQTDTRTMHVAFQI